MAEEKDELVTWVAQLRDLGYQVTAPEEKKPLPKPASCDVCGAIDEGQYWLGFHHGQYDVSDVTDDTELSEWMTKIRVEVGEAGEEGWDYRTLLFCDRHDAGVIEALMELGFKTHHHGSTHPLSDEDCPGDHGELALCPVAQARRGDDDDFYHPSPYDEDYDGTYPE